MFSISSSSDYNHPKVNTTFLGVQYLNNLLLSMIFACFLYLLALMSTQKFTKLSSNQIIFSHARSWTGRTSSSGECTVAATSKHEPTELRKIWVKYGFLTLYEINEQEQTFNAEILIQVNSVTVLLLRLSYIKKNSKHLNANIFDLELPLRIGLQDINQNLTIIRVR